MTSKRADHLQPSDVVETPDGMRFTVHRTYRTDSGYVGIRWTDGVIDIHEPSDQFDVVTS